MAKFGIVCPVRRRPTVYTVFEEINTYDFDIESVLVEADTRRNFSDIKCSKYIFTNRYEVWNKSHALNLGIQYLLDRNTEFIFLNDSEIFIPKGTMSNILLYTEKCALFSPEVENYNMHFGCIMVKADIFRKVGLFNDQMFYWGYEDEDWLVRSIKAGYQLKWKVECGKIHHMEERKRPTIRPPGMKKWNSWEFNKIISDYGAGIDPMNGFSIKNGEPRGKWPKDWMPKKEIMI